jgi:cell division protein FtsB
MATGRGNTLRRLLAVGTGLFVLYLVLLTGQRALDAYRVNQEVEAVRREIDALRSRNAELLMDLSSGRLDEDIERIARQELGMVRPGEQPVTLIWPEGTPKPQPESSNAQPQVAEPNWRTWLRLFVDL